MCKEWYDAEQDRIWHIMHSILKGGVVLQKLQRNNWNTRKIVYHSMFLTNSKIILQNLVLYVKRHVLVECQESLGWTIGWVFSCISVNFQYFRVIKRRVLFYNPFYIFLDPFKYVSGYRWGHLRWIGFWTFIVTHSCDTIWHGQHLVGSRVISKQKTAFSAFKWI